VGKPHQSGAESACLVWGALILPRLVRMREKPHREEENTDEGDERPKNTVACEQR